MNRIKNSLVAFGGLTLLIGAISLATLGVSREEDNGGTAAPVAAAIEPQNFVVSAPACSARQISRWNDVSNNSLRIAGEDPVGAVHGYWPRAPFYPWGAVKQTLCGTLDDYFFYDVWGDDEADWNLNIIPSTRYAYIVDEVKPDASEIKDCAGGVNNCLQAEISPDNNYYGNPWFIKGECDPAKSSYKPRGCSPRSFGCVFDCNEPSPLEGHSLCTYGPWVQDDGHGRRPEIHPSELLWWRSGAAAYLMLLQDDSNRFDRASDFNLSGFGGPPTYGWRPWSQFPRTGKFKLAFALDPNRGPARFNIFADDELHVRRDLTGTADADDGIDHALVYNGRTLLTVHEFADDGNVRVGFEEVCSISSGGVGGFQTLIGFATLTSSIGIGDRGGEGFQLLRVEETAQPGGVVEYPVLVPFDPRPTWVNAKVLTESLHPVRTEEGNIEEPLRTILLGDVEVEVIARGQVPAADRVVSRVELVEGERRRELSFEQLSQTTIKVKNVPVAGGPLLEVTMQSGDVNRLSPPAVSLAPRFVEAVLASSVANPAWNNLVLAAGAQPAGSSPPAPLVRVSRWELRALPSYAPAKEDEASPEDDSPVAEELREAAESGDAQRIQSLFGSPQPFVIQWSFRARNLTTGRDVPVALREAREGTVLVQFEPAGGVPDAKIKVTFPDAAPNDIYELAATARMTDALSTAASETQHRVWSHVLSGAGGQLVEPLIRAAAQLAGVPAEALVNESRLDAPPERLTQIGNCPRLRRAALVRLFAINAVQDGLVTVPELRGLVLGAAQFGGEVGPAPGCNQLPDCSRAAPSISQLWPPNHRFVPINILGINDPDGDPLSITINSIFQDEPVDAPGSGNTCPDAYGVGTSTANVRAERAETRNDGRFYHIAFTAADGQGGTCAGEVTVRVPHSQRQGDAGTDQGRLFDATICP